MTTSNSLAFVPKWLCKFLSVALLCASTAMISAEVPAKAEPPVAIAIHGGAGTILRKNMTDADRANYRGKLTEALQAGHTELQQGRSSLDAVIAAISILEASPLFNAGIGAVMTWEGKHELDASIMSGDDLRAGAVAGVRTVASPIRLARAVMEQSPHVLLSGRGAEVFAAELGVPVVDNTLFTTPRRQQALEQAKLRLQGQSQIEAVVNPSKWGTVGAVALDRHGNLAAGTSTGGMTAKRWGRIGDSPLIGAGTYADNRSCAVSATGHGEYFIRHNVAADICARVRYQQVDIETAGRTVLFDELLPAGGTGGVIIIDPAGNISMPFNTEGMYRGSIGIDGKMQLGIYKAAE